MLHVFGFKRTSVAISELYFVDPDPSPNQEGAEHGVRLEVRLIDQVDQGGSIYASRSIEVGLPLWRADLLESLAGPVGSFDRTHHHPRVRGWEPGSRRFDPEMSSDPLAWVGERLSDLDGLLQASDIDASAVDPEDAIEMRKAVPDILEAIRKLLDGVNAGQLAAAPEGDSLTSARMGWL